MKTENNKEIAGVKECNRLGRRECGLETKKPTDRNKCAE